MAEPTIAEILAERKRLTAAYESAMADVGPGQSVDPVNDAWADLAEFYEKHGPRLAAVAEAAVEWDVMENEVLNCAECDIYHADGYTEGCRSCALRASLRSAPGGANG